MWNDDLLLNLQTDAFDRLRYDPYFSDVPVLLEREGLTEEDLDQENGPLNKQDGKTGACAIVMQPEVLEPNANLPGPVVKVMLMVQLIESRELNNSNIGTKKSAEAIGFNVLNLLHLYLPHHIEGVGSALIPDKRPMIPVKTVNTEWVSYTVRLTLEAGLTRTGRVADPQISQDVAGVITLSCFTPDALIYWTIDGSYPAPGNDAATLYTEPFELPPGTDLPVIMRLVATKADMIPSNSMAYDID